MECTLCREECENMSHVFSIYIIELVDSVSRDERDSSDTILYKCWNISCYVNFHAFQTPRSCSTADF